MRISDSLMEIMGFTKFPDTDVLRVRFEFIQVYSLRGITFQQSDKESPSRVIPVADNCSVVISQSINEASQLLTGDVFDENEQDWLSQENAKPPFLLIHFKSSKLEKLQGGYRRQYGDDIITYDGFLKEDIYLWEEEELPSIVVSLVFNLSTLNSNVELVPVTRAVFGTTEQGARLFDLKFTVSAHGYVSTPIHTEELNTSLEKADFVFSKSTKNRYQIFYKSLNETDKMKQFLGYFFFIERSIHSSFKSLSNRNSIEIVFHPHGRMSELTMESFLKTQRNLSQKFHWCVAIAWTNITESDVTDFLEVKHIRDELSHGKNIEESKLPVEKTRNLALKLLNFE